MLNIEWSLFHCAMLILCDRCFGGGGRRGGGGRLTPAPDLEMTQCPICNARAGKHYCLVCPNVYATVEEVLAHQRARAHMGGHLAAVDGDPSRSARRQTVLAKARARRQNDDDDDDDDDDGGNHGTTRQRCAKNVLPQTVGVWRFSRRRRARHCAAAVRGRRRRRLRRRELAARR